MNPSLLLFSMIAHTGKVITAIAVGVLAGLYIVGRVFPKRKQKDVKPIIKVKGKDYPDLVEKMEREFPKKVEFKYRAILTYEEIVEWVKGVATRGSDDNLGCLIIKGSKQLSILNIDTSSLGEDQKEHFLGTFVVNTATKETFAEQYFIVNEIDDDLKSVLGSNDTIVLK